MTSLTARRCVVCDAEANKRCSSCAKAGVDLFFCSPEHFKEVWNGHRDLCGKSSGFLHQPTARDIAATRAQFSAPLKQIVVKRLVHLLWGCTKKDYGGLEGLRLRQAIKEDWGFDPAYEGPELGTTGSEESAGSVAPQLERMFGMPPKSLLDSLKLPGPDEPDLVPFRDVLIAAVKSINPFPPWYPPSWRVLNDITQLHNILLFWAAAEWLDDRHKAGEPAVDPSHELWWQVLNHRVGISFKLGPFTLDDPATYSKLCFETTCKWIRLGMDINDPQLAEVFQDQMMPYFMTPHRMWPSSLGCPAQPSAESKRAKTAKPGGSRLTQARHK